MLHAITVIVHIGARPELNFLDGDHDLLLLGFVGLLLLLILKLAKVDDLTNRRLSVGRDFDEIHPAIPRFANRFASVHDTELLAIVADHAHLRHANAFVNPSNGSASKIRAAATAKTCSYEAPPRLSSSFQVPGFKRVNRNLKP